MASKLLPYSVLTIATLSGFYYDAHFQHPCDPTKPYILFVHGSPSSAYDWRHQVDYFASQGYGIIAPDTLGYGGSSQPLDPKNYRLKTITNSLVEVVNKVAGNSSKVHGVGHDWGAALMSRLANYHPDRFLSYSFLATGYQPPGAFNVTLVNEETKQLLGYSTLGYWDFFNKTYAASLIDSHKESFVDLIYPANLTATWRNDLGPVGASEQWVASNHMGPRAAYITPNEFAVHDSIFAQHGYAGSLNYYKASMLGVNDADEEAVVAPYNTTTLPVLSIAATLDPLVIIPTTVEAVKAFAPQAQTPNVTAAHWLQLEQPEQVNGILDAFFQTVMN